MNLFKKIRRIVERSLLLPIVGAVAIGGALYKSIKSVLPSARTSAESVAQAVDGSGWGSRSESNSGIAYKEPTNIAVPVNADANQRLAGNMKLTIQPRDVSQIYGRKRTKNPEVAQELAASEPVVSTQVISATVQLADQHADQQTVR